jgi:hypothetical protein
MISKDVEGHEGSPEADNNEKPVADRGSIPPGCIEITDWQSYGDGIARIHRARRRPRIPQHSRPNALAL